MNVGVTGTRQGCTDAQLKSLINLLHTLADSDDGPIEEFHHGSCRGVDVEAAKLADTLWERPVIHCHPAVNKRFEADSKGGETC